MDNAAAQRRGEMKTAQVVIASCSRRGLEIEQIKGFLQGNGYTVVGDDWNVDPEADLILLSTCGFTQAAEDAAFQKLRSIQETIKPGAQVILGGCIPEIDPERVAREFEGPTFSPQSYAKLNAVIGAERGFEEFPRPNTLGALFTGSSLARDIGRAVEIFQTFDGSLSGLGYISQRLSNGARRKWIRSRYANLYNHRTFYIQIQEGCSMHCSYCVICKAIGPLRSKRPEAVLDEFRAGLAAGYRQFQLMGDNAGSYGQDLGTGLADLLACFVTHEGDFALDLTDINPVYLPPIFEPARRLCEQGRLSRLYIPIQSGSRRILKLMNRDCDMDAVKGMLVELKRLARPDFRMGTSVIAGFPSERPEELEATIRFCEEVDFDWVWCHSFSARPETPAASLPDPVPAGEILARAHRVRDRLKGKSLVTTAETTEGSKTCQG
jgi:tRNA A37 methylthiotransferase MiaB